MELSYENADALVRTIGGTSAEHLGAFVSSLIGQQYSVSYVCQLARHALAFGRWCEARKIALHVLSEEHIVRYQRYRRRCRSRCFETRRRERHALELLLDFLREEGICPAAPSHTSPAEDVVMDFAQYLQHDHGLADITVENYTREACQFLLWRFGQGEVRLRDRAVLLLLARLGLRAVEIVRLMLDDIDWDHAQLRIRGKGGREGLLPLTTDVGEAIAAYLEHGRPTCQDRHLFLRSVAPIRGFMEGSYGIGSIVHYALNRANVKAPHRGSHQFRHALAVHLLQAGASLPEIGQVLRHRSPQSTAIYAKVDLAVLRTLAVAWPGGAR
jgi:site-specific recombinase XerD